MLQMIFVGIVFSLLTTPQLALASEGVVQNLTSSGMGYLSIFLFVGAYALVIFEEKIHLRKSKPVIMAAGLIWVLYAITMAKLGNTHIAEEAIRHNLLEYAELFLFLLVAMTYINALDERNAFQALRSWLVGKGFSLRVVFWVTGVLAFIISPVADNLTTALLMGAVVIAVAGNNKKFVTLACINIVVGANAGGAFSPFGDITTLMVWQKGMVTFVEFFDLFIPSLINWFIPALIMSFAVGNDKPKAMAEKISMKLGAIRIMALFLLTIITAVSFHQYLHLPPAAGMMLGLGYLGFFAFYLKKVEHKEVETLAGIDVNPLGQKNGTIKPFDIMSKVAKAEWDTLLFFYGVILCVGGLAQFGYLALVSEGMYEGLGATKANILVGILSAIVDNIPVMYAVLTMHPEMSHGQWLLVTLTAGVGGSLLSIGSAAGVGLMGTARGTYTFGSHLKWSWAVGLGYVASIYAHILINARLF